MHTTIPQEQTSYEFAAPVRDEMFLGLRGFQVGVVASSLVSGLVVFRVGGGVVGVVFGFVLVALGGTMAFVHVGERSFDEWLPAAGHFAVLTLRGRRRWRSPLVEDGQVMGPDGPRTTRPAPPPSLEGVRVFGVKTGHRSIGVIEDPTTQTFTGAIRVRGASFALLETSAQQARLGDWSTVLSAMSRPNTPVSRIQWIDRTVPERGDEMREFFQSRPLEVQAAVPGGVADAYTQHLDSAPSITQEHETYVVVHLRGHAAREQIAAAGGGPVGAAGVLVAELDQFAQTLADADLEVTGVLNRVEMLGLIRTSFDPDAVKVSASEASIWPTVTETHRDHWATDGKVHATFWISQWPRSKARADFLSHVLLAAPGVTRTVSVVMEAKPMRQAMRDVENKQREAETTDALKAEKGYASSIMRRKHREALVQRAEEIAVGHADCRFVGLITVTASDVDTLNTDAKRLEQAAFRAPVELRRLYLEQDEVFAWSMPLGRGLR